MGKVRILRWAGAAFLLTGLLTTGYFVVNRKPASQSAVRVGVDHSPPFYSIERDGTVRGLAVDVFNEAARRRGIHLIWTPLHDIPLDDALSRRQVQMWPLVGATPARTRMFYLSEPWLESGYVLVSLQGRQIRNADEAAGLVVAHARLKLTTLLAHQFLARSKLTVRLYRADAISAVCAGDASAALVESRVLDSILLQRPPGCEDARFHISSLQGATSPLSIAAVPEVREQAAALRAEINNLIADGFLSAKLDEWSPFSAEGTRSIWAMKAVNERSRIYRYGFFLILLFACVLGALSYRAWRLRQAAERAEAGLREAQRRFTAFMDNSPAIAFMKDASGRILYVNRAWSQTFGIAPEEAYGRSEDIFWSPAIVSDLRGADIAALEENSSRQIIETVPIASGELREWLVMKFPFSNEKGERFVGGTAIDITEREAATRQLGASESRYRELFEHNPLPAWVYDRETLEFLTVNDAAIKHYGWTREDFLSGMTLPDVVALSDSHRRNRNPVGIDSGGIELEEIDKGALDKAHGQPGAWRHQTKDGFILSVETTSYELEYEHRPARLTIIRDLTEQETTLEQLRVSEERWQLALRGAGDALWDWDLTTGKVFRSPRWRSMLGYTESEVGDTREEFLRLLHPDDQESVPAAIDAHLARETPVFSAEYRLRHKDGTWRWIMDRGQAVWDERGRPIRMAGSQTDITDRKMAENVLALQARTDALTGVANRRVFDPLFGELVRAARQSGENLSVCVCDLDCFKDVNDSYGHASGDRVLIAFGAILRQNLRKTDLLARVGGDEFLLALPRTSAAEGRILVERIREQLHSAVFVSGDGVSFNVSSSFGVAQLRAAHRNGDELIEEADRLLYTAKGSGRNRTSVAA